MMRSLYAGVAGLKTHQTKMDVIGNNIANVNTVGFKSTSVTFSELMYQTTSNASGANALTGTGGINAKQIGLGVTMGATNVNITTAGATQTTGNPFDLKIKGDSFFIVSDGTNRFFTKAGAFYVDGSGNLAMTSTGYNVMGWQVDETTGNIKEDTVSPLKIMQAKNMTSNPEATTLARCEGIIDRADSNVTSDTGKTLSLNFYDALGYSYTAKFAIKDTDVRGEYTITLSDILNSQNKSITEYYDTDALENIVGFNGTDGYTIKFNTDTGLFEGIFPTGGTAGTDKAAVLDFAEGLTTQGGEDLTLLNFSDISIDFSNTKWFDNNETSTIGMEAGDADKKGAGKVLGALSGISIDNSGKIYGTYDNGNTKLLGQIAVASFANPAGLEKVGENLYQVTLNSGEFDGIGKNVTADGGSMSTGVLEMSNVDLSAEFTEMITTQRGFQANSRIITTSDTLLEELINLKR